MLKKILSVVCLAVMAGTVVAQEAAIKISPKFEVGKRTGVTEVKLTQILSIFGQEQRSKSQNFVTTERTTKSLGADRFEVKNEVKRMQVNMELGPLQLSYDSENPDGANVSAPLQPVISALQAQMKAVPVYEIDGKTNKVLGVQIDKSVLDNVPPAMRTNLSDESLREKYQQSQTKFPKKSVKPGDTWDATVKADLGGGQVMEFEVTYKYEGPATVDGRKLHKITSKVTSVDFDIDPDGGLGVTVKNTDLKVKKSTGTIHYDAKLGAFASEAEMVQVVGKLTLDVNGMESEGTLDLTMENNSKIKSD